MFWVFLVLSLNGAAKAFECNFEKDLCGLRNTASDSKFTWVRERGANGHYMSAKAPFPRSQGGIARLSVKLDLSGRNKCISFSYRTFGTPSAELRLYVDGSLDFKSEARKNNEWHKSGELYFQGKKLVEVQFDARIGIRFKGNIEIDNVKASDCGPTARPPSPLPPVATPVPPPPASCGMGPSPNTRIVGGTTATHGSWPWQAQLRTTSGFPYCGGSLVGREWVLTAAHCVQGRSASSVVIRLGAHHITNLVGTEQDFNVSKIISHSSYSTKSFSHDIALLKLDKQATLNDKVNLVCLPEKVDAPTDGNRCWITGWGLLASGGATPQYLQQASVPIASRARCDKAYPGKIHDSMICAGLDRGGVDACQGDSGGPMVCESGGRYYIHGATSWGYGCAQAGKFGVYAKVKYLLSWVKDQMAKN